MFGQDPHFFCMIVARPFLDAPKKTQKASKSLIIMLYPHPLLEIRAPTDTAVPSDSRSIHTTLLEFPHLRQEISYPVHYVHRCHVNPSSVPLIHVPQARDLFVLPECSPHVFDNAFLWNNLLLRLFPTGPPRDLLECNPAINLIESVCVCV